VKLTQHFFQDGGLFTEEGMLDDYPFACCFLSGAFLLLITDYCSLITVSSENCYKIKFLV